MKYLVFIILVGLLKTAASQIPDSTFTFTGYVLDEDSIPVENAYLINFRTVRGYATDKNGKFQVKAQLGDSIKINHISFQQRIIHVDKKPADYNIYYLSYEPHTLNTVPVSHKNVDQEHLDQTMIVIEQQFKIKPTEPKYFRGTETNPYAPGAYSPGFGISLSDISRLFKKKKK